MTSPYFLMTWDRTLSRKAAQDAQRAIDAVDPSVELMANICIPGSDVRMWLSRPNDGGNAYQDANDRRCVEIVEELLRTTPSLRHEEDISEHKTARWMGDQYVVTETGTEHEWYSEDGIDWVDECGRPIEDETFPDAVIEFIGGPRSGESVA